MTEQTQTLGQAYRTIFKTNAPELDEEGGIAPRPEVVPSAVTMAPIMDLHTHTTYSDGSYSPAEIIRESASRRLRAVAITDHETLGAYVEEPQLFDLAEESGLQLLPGVETGGLDRHPVWKDSGGRWTPHILLYFPRLPDERSVGQHLARLTEVNAVLSPRRYWWPLAVLHILFTFKRDYPRAGLSVRRFLHWLCQQNKDKGIPNPDISWVNSHPCEDFDFWVDQMTADRLPGQVPPRMWNSQVLLYATDRIQEVHDLPDGIDDAYQFFDYVNRHGDRYLGCPEDYPDWYGLTVESAIETAHEHDGVAVYAHPCYELQTLGRATFESWIAGFDFDGYEAYSTFHSGWECLYFAGLGGIQTIGSDFHGVTNPDITLGLGKAGCHGMQTTREQLQTLIASDMLQPSVADDVEWIPVPDRSAEATPGGTPRRQSSQRDR